MKFIDNALGFALGKIFELTGNYGLSIIIFTILVKLFIYPLSLSAFKSQRDMQKLQPKIDELNKKYKNDRQLHQQKLTEFYSEHKFNPLSGCLPVLIQMPIIFALFAVLREPADTVFGGNQELAKQATTQVFLWIKDLSIPDTMFNIINHDFASRIPGLLPILAAVFTYLQIDLGTGKKTEKPNPTAESMNKNMKIIFPLMILFSGSYLSSGVALYWAVSTGTQILQQMYLNKKFDAMESSENNIQ